MNITFDPDKNAANLSKHGAALSLAVKLEWDTAVTWPDLRREYGEARQCALVLLGERLYFVAFVDRAGTRRVISLRKANNREKVLYAELSDH